MLAPLLRLRDLEPGTAFILAAELEFPNPRAFIRAYLQGESVTVYEVSASPSTPNAVILHADTEAIAIQIVRLSYLVRSAVEPKSN